MANRKLGKPGNLGNFENVILSFLLPEFSILAYSQNRKLGFKNLGREFPRFLRFPSFGTGPILLTVCNNISMKNLIKRVKSINF